MALFEGITSNTTEHLVVYWCSDLLQIVDNCPSGYELVECCFSQPKDRMRYYYLRYVTNEDEYLLKSEARALFKVFNSNFFRRNRHDVEQYIKVTKVEMRYNLAILR